MEARLRLVIVGVILIGGVIVLVYAGYRFNWAWTGFGPEMSEPKQHAKTLWDWLNLLGVLAIPAVVGLGAAWYTTQQGKLSDRENTNNQREAALQAYIDNMSELLLHEKLRDSSEEDEVRKIARVRTLTVLRRLDTERKKSVLQFLQESGLINKDKYVVNLDGADLQEVDLSEAFLKGISLHNTKLSRGKLLRADLRETNLSRTDLQEADLSGANLSEADLYKADLASSKLFNTILYKANLGRANLFNADLGGANLREANLSEANLVGANLYRTNLSKANLSHVKYTNEQLDRVASLQGATMPDGSIHL